MALHFEIDLLIEAMEVLKISFAEKAAEFKDVLKMGRTQMQDAVPMTLGQEFSTYAVMLEEDQQRLREAALLIQEINLGATAIGTGINAHPEYAALACKTSQRYHRNFNSSPPAISWKPLRMRAHSCNSLAC